MSSRIKYRKRDVETLARLMKSEALGEGNFGMLLVGNVGVNRIVYKCSPFKAITTIEKMVYQPGNFLGVNTKLFNAPVNTKIKGLAEKNIKFWRADPSYNALYFQNPGKGEPCKDRFWGKLAGKYKNHCFYDPDKLEGCGL